MYRVGRLGQFDEQLRLRPILELVHTANFPVYGFADHPFNLSIYSYGEGCFGQERKLYNITFTFSSPLYPEERDNFELVSSDATVENVEGSGIIYTLRDLSILPGCSGVIVSIRKNKPILALHLSGKGNFP